MRVRVTALVAMAATASGCWSSTTTSTTGPLVTDVGVDGAGLKVRTCAIGYEVTETDSLFQEHSDRSVSMHTFDCAVDHQRLPPGIDADGDFDPPPLRRPPALAPGTQPSAPPPRPAPAPPAPKLPYEVALTRRAQVSAGAGDCRMVRRLGAEVESMYPAYYARTFATDPVLAPCLGGAP